MSKHFLTTRQVMDKIGTTSGLTPSDTFATKSELITAGANPTPLIPYRTNQYVIDNDILKGSKVKYSLYPNNASTGIEWSNGDSGWYVTNGSSGTCWITKNDPPNAEPGGFYLTGREGIEYETIGPKMAFIFRVSLRNAPSDISIFSLSDIDDQALVFGYASNNTTVGANFSVDYRYWVSPVYNIEERVVDFVTRDLWIGIVHNSDGGVSLYYQDYTILGESPDNFIKYIEAQYNGGNKSVIINSSEQENQGGGQGSSLSYIYMGKPYCNTGVDGWDIIIKDIPQWFDISQEGLEVYEGHLAVGLDV